MKYANFKSRIFACIVDWFVLLIYFFIVIIIVGFLMPILVTIFPNNVNSIGLLPFTFIIVSIFPTQMLPYVIFPYYDFDVFIIMFFVIEILYYALHEIYKGKTIGYKRVCIEIQYKNDKYRIPRILLRSVLKALSRYLFFLPLLTMFLSKKKQTIYDILSGAVVYEVENEK